MPKNYNPNTDCGAKTRKGGKCTQRKGHKTDHTGQGKCWLHGGATPIKHGHYSSIIRPNLRKLMDEIAAQPDPLDLKQDVILLRALVVQYAGQVDDSDWHNAIKEPLQVLLTSNEAEDWKDAVEKIRNAAEKRETQAFDFNVNTLSGLVDRVGKMVERVHAIQSEGAITVRAVAKLQEQMALVVARHVEDKDVMAKIEQGWNAIAVDVR